MIRARATRLFRPALAALLALATAFALCRAAAAQPIEERHGVAYGPGPDEVADLCLPAGEAPSPVQAGVPSARRPALLLIHGGGWQGGRRTDLLPYCQYFAHSGIAAMTIDYRLAGKDGRNPWPAQLQDSQLALRWLRAHAAEVGADPARICAWGDSAGGHLVVFLAVLREIAPGDRAGDLAEVPPLLSCAIDNFGPVDFTGTSPMRGYLRPLSGGGDRAAQERLARPLSPLFLVGRRTAPIMIVQGDADTDVPPAQSEALRDALRRAGVPMAYESYHGAHEFQGLPRPDREALFRRMVQFIMDAPAVEGARRGR